MKYKPHLRHLSRAFKLFVLGSFVATRTASGSADPEDSMRHELAWMSVRDGLSNTVSGNHVSGEIRRMVQQEIEKDLDFRVAYTYRAISPDDIAQLDALWMDHLAGADDIDRFLGARTVALRQLAQDNSEILGSPDQLRNVVREFSRAEYSGD